MPITALPLPTPLSTMSEAEFDDAANDFLGALPAFATEANALAATVNGQAAGVTADIAAALDDAGDALAAAVLSATATATGAASTATTKAGEASTSATTATTQAEIATTKASAAALDAADASTNAGVADAAAIAAAASIFDINSKYLGPKASDPTLDNNGDALTNGAWYDNTTTASLRIRRGGVWKDAVFEVTGDFSGAYDDLTGKPTLGTAAAADIGDFATAAQGTSGATAYSWGDHASAGYASGAQGTSGATAYSWGNHASAGYLTGIANDAVTNAKLANVATATLKGRVTAATGDPEDLSAAQVRTLLNVEDGATAGGGTPATAAQIQALTGTAAIVPANVATALSSASPSGDSNYAMNWSATIVASYVVTANRVLSNPTNVVAGTTRVVTITANNTTERTITFGTNFKGTLPTVKVKSTAAVTLFLYAVSSTQILVSDKAWTP